MGQPSLSVPRHRLLRGLLAVQKGNCGWKAVQRKCVALWKRGCLAPKIQFLWSVVAAYKDHIEQWTKVKHLLIGLLRCFASVKRHMFIFPCKNLQPLAKIVLCVVFFFKLSLLSCVCGFPPSPHQKVKIRLKIRHYYWKTIFWESFHTYNYILWKKIVLVCSFHHSNGQFCTGIHTQTCANIAQAGWYTQRESKH